jgi:hypothetical protein
MFRTLGQIKIGEMAGACGRHRRDAYNVMVEKNKRRRQRTKPKIRWEDNI